MPSATTELSRALNAYNLAVGALSSAALGVAVLVATVIGTVPDLLGLGTLRQALTAALGLFVIITGLHTAAHVYFGWRFGRGLRATVDGNHRRAVRWLAPVERAGLHHYDPDGAARRALAASRAALTCR